MSTSTSPRFVLHYCPTPNGKQPAILLEALKEAYPTAGLDYKIEWVNIGAKDEPQKKPEFIKMNPNGRIPVLVDQSRDNFVVFETAAILLYLVQHYDKEHKFWFDPVAEPNDYSEMLQWIFWAHGGVGPMQGQLNHFGRFAPEKIPYAQKRYYDETRRLYNVAEIRLSQGNRRYLAGSSYQKETGEAPEDEGKVGKFTIADIKSFGWMNGHEFSGVGSIEDWPHFKAWLARINNKPAVQAALAIKQDA